MNIVNPYRFVTGANDPYFANVVLLLHCDGTNGSTTFTDSSPSPKGVTAFGNAQISTTTPKFGSGAMLLDGTGDWVQGISSTAWNFGTGDFTVETWVRFNAFPASVCAIIGNYPGTWLLQYRPDTSNKLNWFDGASNYSATLTLSTGVWYHIAVARSGTSLRMFIDGIQTGSTITNTTNYSIANTLTIGRTSGVGQEFNGWLDDMRITKGVARYTSDFTPPIVAFPDS